MLPSIRYISITERKEEHVVMKKQVMMLAISGVLVLNATCDYTFASVTEAADYQTVVNLADVKTPRLKYITKASSQLTISDGTANILCKASGASGIATRVTITAKLQQYVNGTWVTVNTFTLDENSYAGTLSESCHVSKGYTYRVSATVCVRAGLSGETQQVTSREVKY